jgi:hypothetical protein
MKRLEFILWRNFNYYMYMHLESRVQALVLPQLSQAEELEIWDYTTLLDRLRRVYNNPDKVQEEEENDDAARLSIYPVLYT